MKRAPDRRPVLCDKILAQGIVPYGSRLLVGVSGGADSMALLHLLYALRHDLALDIIVVHYDHALRPGSAGDRRFVEKISAGLGLACLSERNRAKCPRGISVEDFARARRFDFFIRMAGKARADGVALAHTRDDLAETVLMRILRGTGLSGLRGIMPRRMISGVLFLRPMLEVTRAEVEGFLAGIKVEHREDPTNEADAFLRNRIRHELIPYIARKFAPAVKEKLAELGLSAASDYDLMEVLLQKALRRTLRPGARSVKIIIKAWKACPQPIRRMVLRSAVERITQVQGALPYRHALLLERAAMASKCCRIPLSCGVEAIISDKFITLS